jgi:hypothetical protein
MFGSSLLVFPKSAYRMKGNAWSVCCLPSSALWTRPRAPLRTNNSGCMEKGLDVGSIESAKVPQLNAALYKISRRSLVYQSSDGHAAISW